MTWDNNTPVPSVDFDFDQIEAPEAPQAARAEAGELLLRMFEAFRCRTPEATANAITAISYLAGGASISEAARKCHLSRAAVRKIARKFRAQTGVRLTSVP